MPEALTKPFVSGLSRVVLISWRNKEQSDVHEQPLNIGDTVDACDLILFSGLPRAQSFDLSPLFCRYCDSDSMEIDLEQLAA